VLATVSINLIIINALNAKGRSIGAKPHTIEQLAANIPIDNASHEPPLIRRSFNLGLTKRSNLVEVFVSCIHFISIVERNDGKRLVNLVRDDTVAGTHDGYLCCCSLISI